MRELIIFVSLSLLLQVGSVRSNSHTIRQTVNGPIEGILETSVLGQKFYAFQGIPFAEPPIKALRFKVCSVPV